MQEGIGDQSFTWWPAVTAPLPRDDRCRRRKPDCRGGNTINKACNVTLKDQFLHTSGNMPPGASQKHRAKDVQKSLYQATDAFACEWNALRVPLAYRDPLTGHKRLESASSPTPRQVDEATYS